MNKLNINQLPPHYQTFTFSINSQKYIKKTIFKKKINFLQQK